MRIYALTPLGQSLSHSIKAPSSPEWKIIFHLKKVGHAEKQQIERFCGLGPGEASAALATLSHKKVVSEITGGE